jgi:hypothetical protein
LPHRIEAYGIDLNQIGHQWSIGFQIIAGTNQRIFCSMHF